MDELVTRQKQLEASYRNEGPEPDVTRYDTAALSEQRDSCWVCPEVLSDPWSSFTCSHVHFHSLGNPVLFFSNNVINACQSRGGQGSGELLGRGNSRLRDH